MRGRKIDDFFSIFIREQHEDFVKQIKKNLSYTLYKRADLDCFLYVPLWLAVCCKSRYKNLVHNKEVFY